MCWQPSIIIIFVVGDTASDNGLPSHFLFAFARYYTSMPRGTIGQFEFRIWNNGFLSRRLLAVILFFLNAMLWSKGIMPVFICFIICERLSLSKKTFKWIIKYFRLQRAGQLLKESLTCMCPVLPNKIENNSSS